MSTDFSYWTLWSNGQRYTFDTYRELAEFSQKLSDERRERIEQNVRPYLPVQGCKSPPCQNLHPGEVVF